MASTDFSANFFRYRPPVVALLQRIAAARASIAAAEILPAQEHELRKIATAETVHYSNLIEGNQLPLIEADRAARGQLDPDSRARIELVNYVETLELIDSLHAKDDLTYEPSLLLRLHKTLTGGLGREGDPHFKPHHEGSWRDGDAFVVDRITNEIMHKGPPADEVPSRVESMCAWLERSRLNAEDHPPPVLAAVAHYGMTDIHPFADGNGRMARLFSVLVLTREGHLDRRLFSIERYYADDKNAYYQALRSVRRSTLNMEEWLTYFLKGLAGDYERIAVKIATLEQVSRQAIGVIQLNPRQERVLTELVMSNRTRLSRGEYETMAGVRGTRAKADLADLVTAEILVRRESGPNTHYSFARHARQERSDRKWTEERIEAALKDLCDNRGKWPSPGEFKAAGLQALYFAASRTRGIKYWRAKLGY